MNVVALVPVSERTGQFGDISPVPLLDPVLDNLLTSGCIDLVGLVVASSEVDTITAAIDISGKPIQVISVEESAFESTYSIVANALRVISADFADLSAVLVHTPRHAFAPPELVRRVVEQVRAGAPSVVPVLPCTDTVKELDESDVIMDTPDRATLRVTQSPMGFAPGLWDSGQDVWRRLPAGTRTIPGHPAARAIRTSFDLAFARDSSTNLDG